MAPPSRRSTNSRRVQYGVFTGYVLAGIGALIGAVLLALSLWRPVSFNGPRSAAQDIVRPVSNVAAAARTQSKTFIDSIAGYLSAGAQNSRLKREMELARIKLKEADALRQENVRLKAMMGLATGDARPVAISRLIGSSSASSRRFAYIGAGRNDGVRVGMPVRSPRGVLGRVLETGRSTSRILLLTDSQSILPVRSANREVVAFAEGRGDGLLQIRLINLGINPLKKGDMMMTSGSGGYYRPNLPVAIVTQVTDDGAIARVISDPVATDYVAIDPIWEPKIVRAAQQPADEPFADEPRAEADTSDAPVSGDVSAEETGD
ncbi:MAG: rod shape-determining protein MreC [Pontixanthobacter sp.]